MSKERSTGECWEVARRRPAELALYANRLNQDEATKRSRLLREHPDHELETDKLERRPLLRHGHGHFNRRRDDVYQLAAKMCDETIERGNARYRHPTFWLRDIVGLGFGNAWQFAVKKAPAKIEVVVRQALLCRFHTSSSSPSCQVSGVSQLFVAWQCGVSLPCPSHQRPLRLCLDLHCTAGCNGDHLSGKDQLSQIRYLET